MCANGVIFTLFWPVQLSIRGSTSQRENDMSRKYERNAGQLGVKITPNAPLPLARLSEWLNTALSENNHDIIGRDALRGVKAWAQGAHPPLNKYGSQSACRTRGRHGSCACHARACVLSVSHGQVQLPYEYPAHIASCGPLCATAQTSANDRAQRGTTLVEESFFSGGKQVSSWWKNWATYLTPSYFSETFPFHEYILPMHQ